MESNYSVTQHDFLILLTTTPYLPTEYGIPTECEICWVLLVTYGVVPIINTRIGKLEPTCLTMQPCESRIAGTRVAVDTVGASSTILTRCAGAFVYIWNIDWKQTWHVRHQTFQDSQILFCYTYFIDQPGQQYRWLTAGVLSEEITWRHLGSNSQFGLFSCKHIVQPEASTYLNCVIK